MDSYKETIKNHQKLDLNEVKMFLDEQINTYELKNYIEGKNERNNRFFPIFGTYGMVGRRNFFV